MGSRKARPPEGNPFPIGYRQHDLWERAHEPAVPAWRDQLRAKRIARGAEAIAASAGLVDARRPEWARRNVHAWQAVMCRAFDKRSEGVRCYLRIRAMRGAHIDSG